MPPGTLYVVATPIGNLADVGARALEVLRQADVVACEDTRTTRTLLARHGIERPTLALHAHNERAAGEKLLGELRAGRSVALVTDAGTPGVSDPGALLVAAAHRAGVRVVPVPGPSAAIAAWSAAGFTADRFLFVGFLPAKAAARRKALEALELPWPMIFYEAPHRVLECVQDLKARYGAERELFIGRELTKKFEETVRLPLAGAEAWLQAHAHRQQGEFVLVLGPAESAAPSVAEAERVLGVLLEALPAGEAARLAARITGVPRNALYRKALARADRNRGNSPPVTPRRDR
ncbi:MAG: 16S rRNA (cytidine(1402)-2'-O)-methyltransferase [Betaproteobacteria bacterium]|nr:16S rRNA (cytidine(1402)-2'-O)-methyltransferase [Betaproteobacteria bacterium]MDH5219922.1 16S rRNA (cytidine(1402)-2'-O)-methyltransferase [Betaproteobacteria bacterium]MDH5349578.1 16S rRNA (cytidine(1402)-2'-O)-methyltransferase [Betaproteobacteria bacterium]